MQMGAELEAARAIQGCPLLPGVEAHWREANCSCQVSLAVGDSLECLAASPEWQSASPSRQLDIVEDIAAGVVVGLTCNDTRVSAGD
jgi:hypothetical protein